jgi:hypothetical protein
LDENDRITYIFPHGGGHQSFGRGGGLSVYIRGTASDLNFTIKNCTFLNNTAIWGGGLFVEADDRVYGNAIHVEDSEFYGNSCPFSTTNGTAGGGVQLSHYAYSLEEQGDFPAMAKGNVFEIDNCIFINNSALDGAGLSVVWSLQRVPLEQVLHIHILRSSFRNNIAKLGAAIHIDQFWLVSQGQWATVWIESCQFDRNSLEYWLRVGDGKPFQLGLGVVLITESTVWFRNSVSFTNNNGNALAVTGGSASFNGTSALFENNHAYEGAGVYLGSSLIELGYGSQMVFRNNTAIYRGGAITMIQQSKENLVTDVNCFVRHVNATLVPADWNVTMQFIDNWDANRTSRNAIYTTSILTCSMLLGSGSLVPNRSKIMCWKGWNYYEDSIDTPVDCKSQIETDIGSMVYTGVNYNSTSKDHVQAFPGWKFNIPVVAKDDLNKTIESDFITSISESYNHGNHSLPGNQAVVYGSQNTIYTMLIATRSERIWLGKVYVHLDQCPPGFTLNSKGTCSCANNYGGDLACNFVEKAAWLSQGVWMHLINGTYYITHCPHYFCRKSNRTLIRLPHHHNLLSSSLCAPNRNGSACGECVEGYGPAVNSRTYECVNCTDSKLGVNIVKYVASTYLPLALLFTVLILFDIRLTTGPANAFILHCQIVSSTFSLDADGAIPLHQIVSHSMRYVNAYNFPYGIFNLEFIENFLSPICLSASFNTLTVLCLDYCIAIFPLIMIAVVVTILKLKEKCTFPTKRRLHMPKSRSIHEALLPAFASFILLSYTKFSTVTAYILATHTFSDENGSIYQSQDGDVEFVHLAGQFGTYSTEYYPYYITAVIVCCTFVAAPPLLLLDYPLRLVEWFISKSRHLQKFYSPGKVYIFMDTFQGCYRNNMRCFAGIYFLFRFLINDIAYRFIHAWSTQFMVQHILCIMMVALIATCRPYQRSFLNYVDILMFTNLTIISCLTHYLYETRNQGGVSHLFPAFTLQYVLIFLPLLYMLSYIVWKKTKKHHKLIELFVRAKMPSVFLQASSKYQQMDKMAEKDSSIAKPRVDPLVPPHGGELEALFVRSMVPNTYQSTVSATVVGLKRDGRIGVHQVAPPSCNSSGERSSW